MMKKIGLALFLGAIILVLSGCGNKPENNSQKADDIVEKAEESVGNKAAIVVPENLKQITPEDWEKFQKANCTNEEMSDICEYYVQTNNNTGEKLTKNLEWNSFCAYVKKYKGEGKFTTGSNDYETLGYEEGSCHQGMYKEK